MSSSISYQSSRLSFGDPSEARDLVLNDKLPASVANHMSDWFCVWCAGIAGSFSDMANGLLTEASAMGGDTSLVAQKIMRCWGDLCAFDYLLFRHEQDTRRDGLRRQAFILTTSGYGNLMPAEDAVEEESALTMLDNLSFDQMRRVARTLYGDTPSVVEVFLAGIAYDEAAAERARRRNIDQAGDVLGYDAAPYRSVPDPDYLT